MQAKNEIGQKVTIKPVSEQSLSVRDSMLHKYAGLIGEIINYYWIRPPTGEFFYLYTVRVVTSNMETEIVLYEDEMEHVISTGANRRKSKA